MIDGLDVKAFCFVCKARRQITDPEFVILPSNAKQSGARIAIRGECDRCDTSIFRIVPARIRDRDFTVYGVACESHKLKCPSCRGTLSHQEGCIMCPSCGWSKCH